MHKFTQSSKTHLHRMCCTHTFARIYIHKKRTAAYTDRNDDTYTSKRKEIIHKRWLYTWSFMLIKCIRYNQDRRCRTQHQWREKQKKRKILPSPIQSRDSRSAHTTIKTVRDSSRISVNTQTDRNKHKHRFFSTLSLYLSRSICVAYEWQVRVRMCSCVSNMDSVRLFFGRFVYDLCMYACGWLNGCCCIGIFYIIPIFPVEPYPQCVTGHHLQSWSSSDAYGALLQSCCFKNTLDSLIFKLLMKLLFFIRKRRRS